MAQNVAPSPVYYPAKHKSLLQKVGLIQEGKKIVIRAYTSDKKSTMPGMQNQPMIDYRRAKEHVSGVKMPNSNMIYWWGNGLTQKDIDIIHQECGVMLHDENTYFELFHGKVLDLSNPNDSAWYKFLQHNDVIAKRKEDCSFHRRFYFFDQEEVAKRKSGKRELKIAAFKLYQEFTVEQMRELLLLMGTNPGGLSDGEVRDLFGDEADKNPALMMERHMMEDRKERVFLNDLIDNTILHTDSETSRIMKGAAAFAQDYDSALILLKDPSQKGLVKALSIELKAAKSKTQGK